MGLLSRYLESLHAPAQGRARLYKVANLRALTAHGILWAETDPAFRAIHHPLPAAAPLLQKGPAT